MSNGFVPTKVITRKVNVIKVDKLEREDLLNYNQSKQSDRVPLVLTCTDALPNIYTILRKHLDTLYNSEEMKQVFPEPPIVAFRGDKNFKDILVHKKHSNVFYNKHNKCEPCGKNCALCKHIMTGNKFYGTDNAEYKFKGYINC